MGVISATSLKLSQNKKEKGKRKIKEIAFIILHSDERACVCSGLRREGRSLHTAFSFPPLGASGSKAPLRHLDQKKKSYRPPRKLIRPQRSQVSDLEEGIWEKGASEVVVLHMVLIMQQ